MAGRAVGGHGRAPAAGAAPPAARRRRRAVARPVLAASQSVSGRAEAVRRATDAARIAERKGRVHWAAAAWLWVARLNRHGGPRRRAGAAGRAATWCRTGPSRGSSGPSSTWHGATTSRANQGGAGGLPAPRAVAVTTCSGHAARRPPRRRAALEDHVRRRRPRPDRAAPPAGDPPRCPRSTARPTALAGAARRLRAPSPIGAEASDALGHDALDELAEEGRRLSGAIHASCAVGRGAGGGGPDAAVAGRRRPERTGSAAVPARAVPGSTRPVRSAVGTVVAGPAVTQPPGDQLAWGAPAGRSAAAGDRLRSARSPVGWPPALAAAGGVAAGGGSAAAWCGRDGSPSPSPPTALARCPRRGGRPRAGADEAADPAAVSGGRREDRRCRVPRLGLAGGGRHRPGRPGPVVGDRFRLGRPPALAGMTVARVPPPAAAELGGVGVSGGRPRPRRRWPPRRRWAPGRPRWLR